MDKKKSKPSSPVAIELLARTLEHQAEGEPSKLNRERKLRDAQVLRQKHLPKR